MSAPNDHGHVRPNEAGLWHNASIEWVWGVRDLLDIWNDDPGRTMSASFQSTGGNCMAIEVRANRFAEWDEEPVISITGATGAYHEDDFDLIAGEDPHVFNVGLWATWFDEAWPEAHINAGLDFINHPMNGRVVVGAHNLHRVTLQLFALLNEYGVYEFNSEAKTCGTCGNVIP